MLLSGTNARANEHNRTRLQSIQKPSTEYVARITGSFNQLEDRLPAPETLALKPEARVMLLKNDPENRWVNGSLGTVTNLEQDRVWVRLDDNQSVVDVERQSWENVRYKWDEKNKKVVTEIRGTFRAAAD